MSDFFDKIESENSQLLAYVEAEMQKQDVKFGKDFAIVVTAALVSVRGGSMLGPAGSLTLQEKIMWNGSINLYSNGKSLATSAAIEADMSWGGNSSRGVIEGSSLFLACAKFYFYYDYLLL